MSNDPVADDLLAKIFETSLEAGPSAAASASGSFIPNLRRALLNIHMQNADKPVLYPTSHGAFPGTLLAVVPPVVVDANRLRDDIRYACGTGRRTILVNAANAGLFRLYCAQHVIDEVAEHSEEWTGDNVTHEAFSRRWLLDYLPLIRVVPDAEVPLDTMNPSETARLAQLRRVDADDIPSAALALNLQAFYLSNDTHALRAVYGQWADLSRHREWQKVLKAGGDAGELGQMIQFATSSITVLGSTVAAAARRLGERFGPLGFLPIALLLLFGYKWIKPDTRRRIGAGIESAAIGLAELYGEYQSTLYRFREAAPHVPTWQALAETNSPATVLTRASLHTLARTGLSNQSARELRRLLPYLPVPYGEHKVRETLRTHACFVEAWAGRWQVGDIAQPLQQLLANTTD